MDKYKKNRSENNQNWPSDLLTSLFCLMLDLTPIFAILTAIVTIELLQRRH